MEKLKYHIAVVSLVLILNSSVFCEAKFFNLCEGGSNSRLNCAFGELMYIGNVSYGLFSENSCAMPPIEDPQYVECVANTTLSQQIVTELCHRKQSCVVNASDAVFGLNSCPGKDTTATPSRLKFTYECVPVDSDQWTTASTVVAPSSTIPTTKSQQVMDRETVSMTLPTAPTTQSLITAPEVCQNDLTKNQDCYRWVCASGVWEQTALDKTDPACCDLWEGCANFGPGELVVSEVTVPTTSEGIVTDTTPDISVITTSQSVSISSTVTSTSLLSNISTQTAESTLTSKRNLVTIIRESEPTTAHIIEDCLAQNTSGRFEMSWPKTKPNNRRAYRCPGDERRSPSFISRYCDQNGIWQRVDTSLCPSPRILRIINEEIDEDADLEELSANLVDAVNGGDLDSGDISAVAQYIFDIGYNLVTEDEEVPQDVINITRNCFEVGDSLLNSDQNGAWLNVTEEDKSSQAMEVVSALESVAKRAAETVTSDVTVQTKSIEMSVRVVQLRDVSENNTIKVNTRGGGKIEFPTSNLVVDSDIGKLVTVFYNQSADIWSTGQQSKINTPVFSATILDSKSSTSGSRRNLTNPFTYTLQHINKTEKDGACVFWDITSKKWSVEGCRRVGGDDLHTECECDHMTNFAVLLDVTGAHQTLSEESQKALNVITYAGCIISIICLFLSWLTFQFLKNLSSDRNTIHKHLVFTLMLAESLFLAAISERVAAVQILCSVIAGCLHFLFLSVFAWTCLEGVQLYIMLIEVFEAERSRTMYYYLVGYGIPAIIVGISAAVDYTGYGMEKVCWLKTDTGFIWSFVGPVAAVLLINIVMLGVAIYMMYNHAKMVATMKHKETTRLDNIKAWVKGAVVLVILLGITWVFGFFFFHKNLEAFAYIFTILNSLQGLFIFIFHCVANEKVQKEYKKVVRRTQWLPDCVRVGYGEHKGLSSVHSSSSGNLFRIFSKRRKSSDFISSSLRSSKKPVSGHNSTNSHNTSIDDHSTSKEPLSSLLSKPSQPISNSNSVSDEASQPLTGSHPETDQPQRDYNHSMC